MRAVTVVTGVPDAGHTPPQTQSPPRRYNVLRRAGPHSSLGVRMVLLRVENDFLGANFELASGPVPWLRLHDRRHTRRRGRATTSEFSRHPARDCRRNSARIGELLKGVQRAQGALLESREARALGRVGTLPSVRREHFPELVDVRLDAIAGLAHGRAAGHIHAHTRARRREAERAQAGVGGDGRHLIAGKQAGGGRLRRRASGRASGRASAIDERSARRPQLPQRKDSSAMRLSQQGGGGRRLRRGAGSEGGGAMGQSSRLGVCIPRWSLRR